MSGTHHEDSPSKLSRFEHCPGSRAAGTRARAGMSDEEWDNHDSNEAAIEGSMLHTVLAGESPPAPLTGEQDDVVAQSRAYKEMHFGDCDTVMVEQQVTLMDGFDVLTEGTADVVGLKPDIVRILDWKYGRIWVPANSPQGKAYAAAAMQTYGKSICEFHIFQPRAGGGKPIMYTSFDEIFQEVKAVIEQAKSPYAKLQAGEHCAYCPARLDCTACANLEMALMRQDDDSLLANPVRLGQAAEVAKVVEKRCAQIIAANKAATKRGEPTGWKIIEKKGLPSITDAKVARDRVLPILSNDEYVSILTVPFGKLRDMVAAKLKESEDLPAKQSEARLIEMLGDAFQRGGMIESCVVDKKGSGK